ncbi:60S ribosomal protein L5 [Pseudoloma neurophilia]|uniref:60S ribosomal protein L5 n=1 Tax=Pseudoloma neurophilia TaxID=146866 RepID=A0A0R0LUA7_9MICR|nr:60S ribosomal protein L5 [Pseudoloma neurophilia]
MSNPILLKSYRPRYQIKKKRNRVTNYTKRSKMIKLNLKKYAHKTRLVVRITNSKIICQLIQSYTQGDKVLLQITSEELKKYGLNVGLKNYASAYATGLLLSRIFLAGKSTEQPPQQTENESGEEDGKMTVFLDIGMRRNTKGGRVYAAMKGAIDGGLYIPHNAERIFNEDLNDKIKGQSVKDYMEHLKSENNEKYNKQFGAYLKEGINESNIVSKYENVIKMIRDEKDFSKFTKKVSEQ